MDQWLENRPEDSLFQASSAASMSKDTEENETEYPNYLRRLLNPSSPSLTTYLREARFSSYVLTKAKHCNRLNAEAEKSSRLSSIKPDIE